MNLTNTIKYINDNAAAIIDNLEHESLEVHKYLIQKFNSTNAAEDLPFQFIYRSFYRLDNAGLTSAFKTTYIQILEEERSTKEPDIKVILEKLKDFRNKKNQESVQFSFATKLVNTINNRFPIYDSEVARVFGYSRPLDKEFEKKIAKYLQQFGHIQKAYEQILAENLLEPALKLFDAKFKEHNASDMKRLDFIFWSAGKLLKRGRAETKNKALAQLETVSV